MAKVVLAYSGGLDTSVAIRWIKEQYNLDVITVTIAIGSARDLPAITVRAEKIGAVKALVVDGRSDFVRCFVWPALQAGGICEGGYGVAALNVASLRIPGRSHLKRSTVGQPILILVLSAMSLIHGNRHISRSPFRRAYQLR